MGNPKPLPAAVEAHIRGLVGSVSGCTVETMRWTRPATAHNAHLMHVFLQLSGWSPSLHDCGMTWRTTIQSHEDPLLLGAKLAQALSSRLSIQRERLAAGIAMGRAVPFGARPAGSADVEHLEIDAGLATLLAMDPDQHPRETVVELVRHVFARRFEGLMEEVGDVCNGGALCGLRVLKGMHIADGAIYDGRSLWVQRTLPETLAAACVGRRLGELASVPSCIADHRVVNVVDDGDEGTEFHVEPIVMLVRDIDGVIPPRGEKA
jgi:hypothetical protein